MGRPGMWTWTLCAILSWMYVGQALGKPLYMVAIPALLEAGAETKFCASLLHPGETLVMTVTLISQDKNITLLKKTSSIPFHTCTSFKVPLAKNGAIQNFQVEVRGPTFYSKEVRKVMIKVYQPVTFIQTDKPIYLPGQTVYFRIVTLDTQFRPVNQLYNIIEIQDANTNRIGQWLNEMPKKKILQLSYSLNSESHEGTYQIIVTVGEEKLYQAFTVEKYVLPKFSITVNVPDEVNVAQEEITAEVCANYTYRQPVPGTVKVGVCRPIQPYINVPLFPGQPDVTSLCYNETKQMEKYGCATFTIRMSPFAKADTMFEDMLDVKADVEEDGTGISESQEKKIRVSYVVGRLSIINTPNTYVKGSLVMGKVKAVDYNNVAIPGMKLYLLEGEIWSSRLLQTATTNRDGVAIFSLSTANYSGDIHLYVSNKQTLEYPPYNTAYYETGDHRLSMAQPASPDSAMVSFLKVKNKDEPLLCDIEEDIFIKYTIAGKTQVSVDVIYLVLSRGVIVMQGLNQVQMNYRSVSKGEVSFKLKVTPEMSPQVQVVAYAVLSSETVIANNADFSTEKCFRNKVSVEFFPPSAVPGEKISMQVTADPDSVCGISAVDQSVFIKEPGKNLNADKIFDLLPVIAVTYFPYEVQDPTECLTVREKREVLPYPGNGESDPYTIFQNVGLKMATNLFIQMPSCVNFKGREYHYGFFRFESLEANMKPVMAVPPVPAAPSGGAQPPVVTVRTYFPETWIWDLVEVGVSRRNNLSITVPDTITTWETEAFCLSPRGFGLAPQKEILVFQPFFLDLTLPYSIIRGERFDLKATIFNYLTSCIMVTVTPAFSADYTLTQPSGQTTFCLCSSERKTVSWTMVPSTLGTVNVSVTAEAVTSDVLCNNKIVRVPDRGRIDMVTQSLIVKAEGTEMTKTYNWLLCPEGKMVTEETNITLPNNVINGSAYGLLSVLGDILGRALQNLDGLLQMPYGCGEQNIALLASDVYILQYLKNTQQLTSAIKEEATSFLTDGYQRQLNYKDNDGAYSTFGLGPGNTWLTAFVMRTFKQAQSFIYIDPTTIEESKTWLQHKQQTSGCFEQSGNLFNNRMKGGVSGEVTLSAYITAAFLEMKMPTDTPVITKSLSCLKKFSDFSNTYTTALLAYVFTLAGDMKARAPLLLLLDTVAVKERGFLYWSQTSTETSASLSVEISSYVLLAKLSASPTNEDLGYSSRIVRWLTGQQNYYGGFSSTQDTVVALQALALYSSLVFSPKGSSTVTVQSPSGLLTFDVNQDNKLLYQEKMLQEVTGKYSLEVKGTACVSVQISLIYNIPTPTDVTTLSLEVKPEATCTMQQINPKLTLKLKSLYSGNGNSTNMVILDIKMLSGFVPDPESLTMLQHGELVDNVQQDGDHVLVYIQKLSKGSAINYSLVLLQVVPVQNLKPAVIKIYDYYEPNDQSETAYIYPCAVA